MGHEAEILQEGVSEMGSVESAQSHACVCNLVSASVSVGAALEAPGQNALVHSKTHLNQSTPSYEAQAW